MKGLTPIDYFACTQMLDECKAKKEIPCCWLVMNEARKKEWYEKAVTQIRAARWEFRMMTEQGINITLLESPQYKQLFENWVYFENEMQAERNKPMANPKAWFVPAYMLGLEETSQESAKV